MYSLESPPSETKDGSTVRAADKTEFDNVPREIALNSVEPEAHYSRNPPPAGVPTSVQNTEIDVIDITDSDVEEVESPSKQTQQQEEWKAFLKSRSAIQT
ncbi:unnamed protein product, partial [Allacma fusca]